ncbi:MAG: hypothetical protein II091_03610, partial [Lachnospiraceae bacterium]|nr:hypothetical protein [Lachnospiraceae bacterium]
DCISREQAINAVNMCSNSETILNLQQLPSITPQEPVKKLEEQIKQLQNRCHALTHGQICVYCLHECEHKAESEEEE